MTHGLLFGVERINESLFLKFKAIGTLTHEDYERINPIIDLALTGIKEPKIDVLVDISELDGWDLEAAWDDLKLGLKYGNSFNKIAIYGEKSWVKFATKISSWFINGEVKQFKTLGEAISWIKP
ncbi:MAG: STAS/SEC14 domain-containing protein [Arcobacter sp.]|nr:MAG: STAS/SEC14 domain-containing protein [Arcobacter sp.]